MKGSKNMTEEIQKEIKLPEIEPESLTAKRSAYKKAKEASKDHTEEIKILAAGLDNLTKLVTQLAEKQTTPVSTSVDKEVKEATSDDTPLNPNWKKKAQEILGDYLEDVQVYYPKTGGTHFTLIIKKEKSNATPSYWSMFKQDRRTKEIGNTGIDGVQKWCELVKRNLTVKSLMQ
jgi:hypothetical protein